MRSFTTIQMKKIIIAIDGFSSTGKSTIAKLVAKKLQYIYIDSGAMYRAVTLLAKRKGCISMAGFVQNEESKTAVHIDFSLLLSELKKSKLEFLFVEGGDFAQIHLNGKNIEEEIRTPEIAKVVSEVSKNPEIRKYLVDLQRNMGKEKGIVMDGRDIGTIVFPSAELKIFMTAQDEIRAERRLKDFKEKNENISFEEVLQDLKQRDFLDTTRKESPLKKAQDAFEIDNSFTTINEVVSSIVNMANVIVNN